MANLKHFINTRTNKQLHSLPIIFMVQRFPLGRSQAVRQWFLVPPCVGSNPTAPAIFLDKNSSPTTDKFKPPVDIPPEKEKRLNEHKSQLPTENPRKKAF